jgi:hypothetical protein
MLGEKFNFEDVFFRDLTVCVLDTLEGQVKWVNRFSSGDLAVEVPFYYSLTGDERFLLDSFSDDIVSENRFIELNTDNIPRGHLTMTGFNIKSDEFANPNVWLRMVVENDQEIRKVLAKVRAIPISVNYDLTITLASELDTFKCAQAIMDTMWIYKFMYFEHNFMNIDAVILMPDTNQIEMAREKNLTSDNNIQLKVSFEVSTYYPAFRKDRVSATGRPTYDGTGMSDLNGFTINGGVSDLFGSIDPNFGSVGGTEYPGPGVNNNNHYTGTGSTVSNHYTGDPISGYPGGLPYPFDALVFSPPDGIGGGNGVFGMTDSFYDTASTGNPFGTGAGAAQVISNGRLTNDPDYYQIAPKRTRWFNNILRSRERSSGGSNPKPPNPRT